MLFLACDTPSPFFQIFDICLLFLKAKFLKKTLAISNYGKTHQHLYNKFIQRCTIAKILIYMSIFRKKQGKIVAAQNSQEIFDIEGYCTGTGRGKDS